VILKYLILFSSYFDNYKIHSTIQHIVEFMFLFKILNFDKRMVRVALVCEYYR